MASPRRSPAPEATPSPPTAEVHHSLALAPALTHLERREGARLLDLGPARPANISILSSLVSRLFVADLYAELPADTGGDEADTLPRFESVCARSLPRPVLGPFDLILAWDLLDYLSRRQIAALARCLTPLVHPGTLLYALVATRREMPARPTEYEIQGPQNLVYRAMTRATRPAPRYKEPELLRLLPGFRVDASFLLRHGVQEYLLLYRPVTAPADP